MGDYQLGKKNMRDNLSAVVVATDLSDIYLWWCCTQHTYICPPQNTKVTANHALTGKVFIDASYDGELMAQTKAGMVHSYNSTCY